MIFLNIFTTIIKATITKNPCKPVNKAIITYTDIIIITSIISCIQFLFFILYSIFYLSSLFFNNSVIKTKLTTSIPIQISLDKYKGMIGLNIKENPINPLK